MRTVFFGTPSAAVPSLEALAASKHSPLAVTCQPDRPRGRGRRLAPPPVKEAALRLGLPVLQPESVATVAFRKELAALEPELLVVVAYGRLLGSKLLATSEHGAVNLHFSLLPRWRGAAPVQRAILGGDRNTGVTVIQLVQELDAGPVLASATVEVGESETAPELEARLAVLGAPLLVEVVDAIARGTAEATPQPEEGVTLAPPLRREEGDLDPEAPADELARRVRGLQPWPGTRIRFGESDVAVTAARVAKASEVSARAGTVLAPRGEDLPLACGGGSVLLLERVRPPGRKEMAGRSLVDGRLVRPGDRGRRPTGSPVGGGCA